MSEERTRTRRRAQSTTKSYKEYLEEDAPDHPHINKVGRTNSVTDRNNNNINSNNNNHHEESIHDLPPLDPTARPVQLRMIGNYCVERTIGRGQFGKVKLAYHKKVPDMKVAIKIINKTKLDEDTLKMIQREVHIMKLLQHPNIIRLYEVLETPRTLYLIMEYAEGGEVMDFIIAHGKIPEREAKRFFAQMLSAVQYCHSKKCCHRDLKPENLLLDSNMNVKIIDFGLSNLYTPGDLMKTFCGSPTYASPELILRKEYLGPPVDVWSMGVVLFVLVCGYLPFDGHNFVELFNKILKAQYTIPSHVSQACANLIERMLVVEPDQRATIEEIKKHPWLSSVQDCMPDVHVVEISDETKVSQPILMEMESLGFKKEEVVKSLLKNTFDDAAAMYFLLDSKRNQRRVSISFTSSPNIPISSPLTHTPIPATPPTTFSVASPPPSPPTSPILNAAPKPPGKEEGRKTVGFNIQPKEKGEEKNEKKSSGGVHRRAVSEAMKEQVLKAAKAEHERLKLAGAQFSTPQAKPPNFRREPDPLTPTLSHTVTTPTVKHTVGLDDDWSNSPSSDKTHDHKDGEDNIISRSPSRMSSLISNFKSMWRKDRNKQDQPRVVRFAFHINTMSEKSPDAVVTEVQTVLKECGIPYTMKGKFCANCVVEGVHFSIEVCKIPRMSLNGIRFSRISGSAWKYKTIVKDLVVHLKL